ncbi:MAG: CHAD domain-containing protein [Planctomycetes bacterium]|nr:CHAD domain-containing protein [Planctomycetota bacterium]
MTSEAPSPVPPTKRLAIDPSRPLGEALGRAMGGIIAYARAQTELAVNDPEKAVHGYRKSVRRSRALLRLLRKIVPNEEHDALAEDLREAMRETSAARDADVLVALVAEHERKPKTQEALDALEALLREQQAAVVSEGRLVQALREGSRQLAGVPARVETHLRAQVDRRALREALASSHRRARRGFKRARQTLEDQDVHTWRKRVKELRYQLELVEPLTGVLTVHRRLADLAESLGTVTDLIVLRDCALAHRDRLPAETTEHLIERLESKIKRRTEALLASEADLFSRKPKAFADRVLRGVAASGRLLSPRD